MTRSDLYIRDIFTANWLDEATNAIKSILAFRKARSSGELNQIQLYSKDVEQMQ